MAIILAWLYGVIGTPATPPGLAYIGPSTELSVEPGKEVHVLILGTSLTAYGDWTSALSEALRECPRRKITVEVLARPGASSQWGIKKLAERLERGALATPNVIVAEFSINDAVLVKGLPVFLSARNHRQMIELATAHGAQIFLATMNPAWRFEAWQRPGQRRYRGLYRDLAESPNVGLIDTIPVWREFPEEKLRKAVPDGLHPTDVAMKAVTLPAFQTALHGLLCSG